MQNRRFTRLTNAFSKKFHESPVHALGLYFAFYNLCRIHKSLRVTPAMAAGITDKLWTPGRYRGVDGCACAEARTA